MQQKDYYNILGVAESASQDEIKSAYRKLAKQYHPDKTSGDAAAEQKFKDVSEAYEILGNPEKRKKYDELRKYGNGGAQGSMSYEDFMSQFGNEFGREQTNWGYTGGFSVNDIFDNLFGGGDGFHAHTRQSARNPFGQQGTRVRWTKADTAQRSTEPQPTSDPFFKRKGNDAYVDIPINIAQAALGSKVRVRTPGGKRVQVQIPAGTQPDALLRVPGMGYNGGNLYIRTRLSIPKNLTEEQKAKLKEAAEALGLKW
ncbi:MAG: hypothetical protein CL946_01420 [Ectothiorhodospiraceae bacterium]|nr:hypothetical protein [Ectothiorhodospiraceae bacterium]